MWELTEKEREQVYKVTNWVAYDQATKSASSDAHSAPLYITLTYQAHIVRRVKMAEIPVEGKVYRLGSDIPPLFIDYKEILLTPREQQAYNEAAVKYLGRPDTFYQPKEKTV